MFQGHIFLVSHYFYLKHSVVSDCRSVWPIALDKCGDMQFVLINDPCWPYRSHIHDFTIASQRALGYEFVSYLTPSGSITLIYRKCCTHVLYKLPSCLTCWQFLQTTEQGSPWNRLGQLGHIMWLPLTGIKPLFDSDFCMSRCTTFTGFSLHM